MDHKAYSKAYNQSKTVMRQRMDEAIKCFKEQNPKRFVELQAQAIHELEHPPERPITRYTPPIGRLNTNQVIAQLRDGEKDYFVHTVDCWDGKHLYFETLTSESEATDVVERLHPKFTKRNEKVMKVVPCTCPRCS